MKFILTLAMVGSLSAQMVINEVYYDSPTDSGKEPYIEWIELYNAGEDPINLSNWIISDDPDGQNPGSEGAFTFPEITLDSHQFLLLVYNADTFINYFGPIQGQYLEYGEDASALKMGNSGEDLHLFDSDLSEVDRMWYGSGGDLDSIDAAPDVPAGHSVGRVPDGHDTDVPSSDFEDLETPSPGTFNASEVKESDFRRRGTLRLRFWPSPASHEVWFVSKDKEPFQVKIRAVNGRTLRILKGVGKFCWVPDLPQGLYIVTMRNSLGQEVSRPLILVRN